MKAPVALNFSVIGSPTGYNHTHLAHPLLPETHSILAMGTAEEGLYWEWASYQQLAEYPDQRPKRLAVFSQISGDSAKFNM